MKLKDNFVLRQIADIWVVLPLSVTTLNFDGMLTLNQSGAMLWRMLEQGNNLDGLVKVLTSEYSVEPSQAKEDVEAFLCKLRDAGCLLDDD